MAPEVVLLFGRILLLGLLYLFLFAVVRTGVGLVSAVSPAAEPGGFVIAVVRGPRTLQGTRIPLSGPVVIGRAPDADIVIADSFVSSRHARVSLGRSGPIVEDLGSTNGTLLNGAPVAGPAATGPGDVIAVGPVELRIEAT